jgi:hypothetical protein
VFHPETQANRNALILPSPLARGTFTTYFSYMHDYNSDRTHLSLNKDVPVPWYVQIVGRIFPAPILGRLHHQ